MTKFTIEVWSSDSEYADLIKVGTYFIKSHWMPTFYIYHKQEQDEMRISEVDKIYLTTVTFYKVCYPVLINVAYT